MSKSHVQAFVLPLQTIRSICILAIVSVPIAAQTRHSAAMRASAKLDDIAKRPESRAIDRTAPQRETYEPERALRKRVNAEKLSQIAAAPQEPETLPAAAALVPPI